MASTQQQSKAQAAQKPQQTQKCGACNQKGHILGECTRKVDFYGFLIGCPRCNTTKHNIDQCTGPTHGKKKGKKPTLSDLWFLMVLRRIGKPPVRSALDFRFINPERWARLERYPQTCQFAAARRNNKIGQGVDERIEDPSWANPDSVRSQVHPLEANRPQASTAFTDSSTPASTFNQPPIQAYHLAESINCTGNKTFPSGAALAFKIEQESNHTVPPAIPPFSGFPPTFPFPQYHHPDLVHLITNLAAQEQISQSQAQQVPNVPHFGGQSVSEPGRSEPDVQSRGEPISQPPSVLCESCGKNTHEWHSCD
jgi:hypothetical protein